MIQHENIFLSFECTIFLEEMVFIIFCEFAKLYSHQYVILPKSFMIKDKNQTHLSLGWVKNNQPFMQDSCGRQRTFKPSNFIIGRLQITYTPTHKTKREAPSLHDAISHWLHANSFLNLVTTIFGLDYQPFLRTSYLLCLVIPWEQGIVHHTQCFLGGPNLAKFRSEKYVFDLYKKDFSMGKMAQIRQILKKRVSKSLDFYDKFQ